MIYPSIYFKFTLKWNRPVFAWHQTVVCTYTLYLIKYYNSSLILFHPFRCVFTTNNALVNACLSLLCRSHCRMPCTCNALNVIVPTYYCRPCDWRRGRIRLVKGDIIVRDVDMVCTLSSPTTIIVQYAASKTITTRIILYRH